MTSSMSDRGQKKKKQILFNDHPVHEQSHNWRQIIIISVLKKIKKKFIERRRTESEPNKNNESKK